MSCSKGCTECLSRSWHSGKGYICCFFIFLLLIIVMIIADELVIAIHGEEDVSWNMDIEDMMNNDQNSSLLYNAEDSWSICEIPWNGNLSTFDLTVMPELAYALGNEDVIGLTLQEMVCLYFDPMNDSAHCSWRIVFASRDHPYFMHLRNDNYSADLIAIRGTLSLEETMQDFVLYNQVGLMQIASWTIPMTSILPRTFIANLVYEGGLFEGIISENLRKQYDAPIFEYVRSLFETTTEPIDSLYFVGHSLGGGLAKIVGTQIYRALEDGYIINTMDQSLIDGVDIKSFSVASPGLAYGARKFSIHIEDIYKTSIEIRPRGDPVSMIDMHVGQVAFVECLADSMMECHMLSNTICKMMSQCNAYKLHNPDLVATWCEQEDPGFLMRVWNMTYYTG